MQYLLLFSVLFVIFYIYIKLAFRYSIVDKPNNRSSHSNETVRGGGIIIPISALIWFVFSGFQFPLFFSGLIIIGFISFLDDLSYVSPKFRLIIHIVAILLLFSETQLYQLQWWIWISALIISVGIINAYNFMDGINGITGGYSLAILIAIWFVNNYQVAFISNDFIYYIIISITIFFYFNFRKKAKCFAGDVGSISIAFIIVFLLTKLIIQSENWLYILFLCIYGIDTGITMLYRIKQKEDIFIPHRKHLYQLLVNEYKISQLKVAVIYIFLQLIICLIIFIVSSRNNGFMENLIIGVSTILIFTTAFHLMRFHINHQLMQ